jgi:hypothetical protein
MDLKLEDRCGLASSGADAGVFSNKAFTTFLSSGAGRHGLSN